MHFRNGAVAISYVSTLLLVLVDEKKVSLDDKASKWVPEIPHSDEVTLRQLAQMTTGYTDYVIGNAEVDAMLYTDPFRQWTPEELLQTVTAKPLLYPPGTNWNYAHTNYLILGLALEKATGKRMSDLMQEKVLGPLGADEHHRSRPRSPDHPRARAARLHLRTPIAAGHPGGNTVLRGIHVLEPVVDDHPRCHPDHEHL
jgi:CubicO group peptidase (beta-lactamase class C family)